MRNPFPIAEFRIQAARRASGRLKQSPGPKHKDRTLGVAGPWILVTAIAAMIVVPACSGKRGPAPEQILPGRWIGSMEAGGDRSYTSATWTERDGQLRGTLDQPFGGETDLEIAPVTIERNRIRFEVKRVGGDWAFEGRVDSDEMEGTFTVDQPAAEAAAPNSSRRTASATGPSSGPVSPSASARAQAAGPPSGSFVLTRIPDADPASFEEFVGSYRLDPDRIVCIAPYRGEMGCPYLVSIDFSNGRLRALFPRGADRFVSGPAFLVPSPRQSGVEFLRDVDAKVSTLRWQDGGSPPYEAPRIVFHREQVRFESDDATLAGTLTMPTGVGPFPAVVLIHGSGAQTRDLAVLKWIADWLALHDTAVLAYDKRGVGQSTGSWNAATIEDLADDALAAVSYLRSRQDISPRRIGLWGISQGGWIAANAAARSRNVAFVIMVSGAGVSVARQNVDRIELALRGAGFPEADVQAAVTHERLFYDAVMGKATWDRLEASIVASRDARWAAYMSLPTREHFDLRAPFLRRFFSYDPAGDLARIRGPVLALFGGRDIIVPPDRNVGPMEEALKRGHADYTIKVFPTGDHVLSETPSGSPKDEPFVEKLVPDYLETVRSWLEKIR